MPMLPSFKKLHYEKNWFTALFSIMSRVVLDADSKQPLFFFKMNWSNGMEVYGNSDRTKALLHCQWSGKPMNLSSFQSWDVLLGDKKVGAIKMELLKSLLSLGTEQWTISDAAGKECLVMEPARDAALKHVLDELVGAYYNPTHAYLIKNMRGLTVASISMKHGIFKSQYDLAFEKGDESDRALVVALFAALLLMLKK